MTNRISRKTILTVREQLELFVDDVKRLRETTLLAQEFNPTLSIKLQRREEDFEVTLSQEEVQRDLLVAVLTAHRRFIADREPSQLYKIFNTCERCITSEELKQPLRRLREDWKLALSGGAMQINVDGIRLDGEEVLDRWLNGEYLHSDIEHREALAAMPPGPALLHSHLLRRVVFGSARVIFAVERIVNKVLESGAVREQN